MEDAPFPPKAGDARNTPARRSGTRLSDAEAVTATRLDVFGDNSLTEAPTGAPADLGVDDGEAPPPGTTEGALADEPLPAGLAGQDAQPAIPDLPLADTPTQLPFPPSAEPQRLDPAVDAENEHTVRDLEHADSDPPLSPQFGSPSPDQWSEPEPATAATPAPLEVSAIFNALDAAEKHAEADRDDGPTAPVAFGAGVVTSPGSLEHNGWAGVSAELISKARQEGDAVAEDASGSTAATGAESPTTAFPTAQAPEAPSFPEPAGAPPDPLPIPAFPDLSGVPPFPDSSVVTVSAEPSQPPPFREELGPPPAPLALDAAAKIAAQANATAEALENLKRLLESKLPDAEHARPAAQPDGAGERVVSSPPLVGSLRMSSLPEPPPFAVGAAAPLLPLPVPAEPRSGRGVYLLGFLTGLGLSLMAGAVLYFFINTG